MKKSLGWVICFLLLCTGTSFVHAQVPTYKNIHIATAGRKLLLDLYLPAKKNPPPPLLIYIHGGAWLSGGKDDFQDFLLNREWVKKGYAAASITYRLTSDTNHPTFPAQIYDVKVAVRYLRKNASLYGYDANKFAAFGTSAGGYLAALLGTSCGVKLVEGGTLYGASSSCVQAVVDFFGPTDLLNMDLHVTTPPGSKITHDAANSPESLLIGWSKGIGDLRKNINNPQRPYPSYKALIQLSNPLTHINSHAPPFFIGHGKDDQYVPLKQSTILANALKKKGVKVVYRQVPNEGHGDIGNPAGLEALKFLESLFNKKNPPEPHKPEPPSPEPPSPEPPHKPEPQKPEPPIQPEFHSRRICSQTRTDVF